jgi:hypothetical protein
MLGQSVLGTTVPQQAAAIFTELARISRDGIPDGDGDRSELVQQDGWLFEVIAGRPYRIRTPGQLQSLVIRACMHDDEFRSPWMEYYEPEPGWGWPREASPCPGAWRVAIAGPAWPGVRMLAEVLAAYSDGGGGEPETIEQRAVMLLRQAMAARTLWEVSVTELAETIGWEGTPKALAGRVEQLAWAAGIRLTRPLSPSGRPKRNGTGRAVLRLEAQNGQMLRKGDPASGNAPELPEPMFMKAHSSS